MSKPQVVARFAKNALEDVVVSLDHFRGVDLVDMRVHTKFADSLSDKMPTKKGISIKRELLGVMIEALQAAQAEIASPTGGAV